MTNNQPIVIYTIVALCDNKHQGIVPVSPKLGNGNDFSNNLYWGAGGVDIWMTTRRCYNWSDRVNINEINNDFDDILLFVSINGDAETDSTPMSP